MVQRVEGDGERRTKTETIKERAIYVYLPSQEMVKDWKKRAKRQGASISKFVIEHVENSLHQEEVPTYKPRGELIKEIGELRNEIKELQGDNRQKRIVIERLEHELRRYRTGIFLEERFEGVRKYDKELIEILKKRGVVDSDALLRELNIDPREGELVQALAKQLENLETYGLVSVSKRGWRWQG
jgi:predicted  nucleic acid-binding Zn-ribbon protein